jgi:hypothetical protein
MGPKFTFAPASKISGPALIARLLATGFMIEVFHLEWLANHVLVVKKNDT